MLLIIHNLKVHLKSRSLLYTISFFLRKTLYIQYTKGFLHNSILLLTHYPLLTHSPLSLSTRVNSRGSSTVLLTTSRGLISRWKKKLSGAARQLKNQQSRIKWEGGGGILGKPRERSWYHINRI